MTISTEKKEARVPLAFSWYCIFLSHSQYFKGTRFIIIDFVYSQGGFYFIYFFILSLSSLVFYRICINIKIFKMYYLYTRATDIGNAIINKKIQNKNKFIFFWVSILFYLLFVCLYIWMCRSSF